MYRKRSKTHGYGQTGSVRPETASGKWIKTTANHPYLVQVASPTRIVGKFEVDISGRIEEMNKDTYIALANKYTQYVIRISSKQKRVLKAIHQAKKHLQKFGFQIYAQLIHQLIYLSKYKVDSLTIDHDYEGREREIDAILRMHYPHVPIFFRSVGKGSPADRAAYKANVHGMGIDVNLTAEKYLAIKKGTQVALKGTADATDHRGWIPGSPSHRVPSPMYHKDKIKSSENLLGGKNPVDKGCQSSRGHKNSYRRRVGIYYRHYQNGQDADL